MNPLFTPQEGPFAGGPQPGFGPGARRDLRGHRRHSRHEFRDTVRDQRGGPFGTGGLGFGRDVPGFGPAFVVGIGSGFGPGQRGGRRGPGRGGRGRRGDVRAAILKLLTERPMHGYEMIQEIAERTQDLWKPSPGSVYPTLQLLEDEGLIAASTTEASSGSRKLFELTAEGRTAAEKIATAPWDEITQSMKDEAKDQAPGHADLRAALNQLFSAVAQSAHAGSADQQQRIVDVVNNARREIYQILGED